MNRHDKRIAAALKGWSVEVVDISEIKPDDRIFWEGEFIVVYATGHERLHSSLTAVDTQGSRSSPDRFYLTFEDNPKIKIVAGPKSVPRFIPPEEIA